ncbi:MAG: formylglycine-generating enzyme family protein [Bacteroidia bacterium]|nr:formylglycine-generating enzyme family protein [Bacteroidia bacterium]
MTLTTPATTIETLEENMVFVEGGSFMMGSENYASEKPIHEVQLSNFYMARYPVTQALWKAVMGSDPKELSFPHPMRPVEGVSWDDSQKFITKLNAMTGKTYRLPTEAEWEYAARGGKYSKGFTYAGSNNLLEVGWYNDNSQRITQPVGLKRPNELGLFDMSGNVWEWCRDWYGETYYQTCFDQGTVLNPENTNSESSRRVLRGGSWDYNSDLCRVALRDWINPVSRYDFNGFRVARD